MGNGKNVDIEELKNMKYFSISNVELGLPVLI